MTEGSSAEMGRFVNPDNSAFQVALNSKIYVDKTGLIEYTNSVLDTTDAYICNSRPRRFGKSYTANIHSKDEVLTYMIHLGYLGYDQYTRTAFIPNEEIRQELTRAVQSQPWNEMLF